MYAGNIDRRRKKVKYLDTSTIYEGMPVCYDFDATTNITGYSKSEGGEVDCQTTPTTTDEGYQNEAKYLVVEDPAAANLNWFAGVVASGSWCGTTGTGDKWIEIYIPNGAIVPVRTNANCTVGVTPLGVGTGGQYVELVTGDSDPLPCALAEETVDRSSTAGLVLAKMFNTGQMISSEGAYFAPRRGSVTGYRYGINVDGTEMLTGTAASKSYVVNISGDRETAAATGDSNDAMLKVSGSNYGANDTNFYFAGLNVAMNNRDGGTLGKLYNNISISLKQGSTAAYGYALALDAQDLSENAKTEFGGLDIAINREGLAATTEFGMQLRTRGTINTAINTAIRVSKDATDHGFINLFNIEADAVDVEAATGDTAHDSSDIVIPIVYDGDTYYIVAQDSKG
jgi:hypothetical protein